MLTVDILKSPTVAQLGAIARLYEETGWWADADAHRDALRRLIEGSYCFFIASEAGAIVGMGRAISDGVSDAYLQDIAVSAERRGEGIATRIVTAIVHHLEENGIDWIGLIAEGEAHGVYTRCGFRPMADNMPMRYHET